MTRPLTPEQTTRWEAWKAERKAARRTERAAKRSTTPVVALRRVRCPDCGSIKVKTTRTLESDREIVSRRQSCQACGCAFIVIFD